MIKKKRKKLFVLSIVIILLMIEIFVVYKYLFKKYKNKDFGIETYVSSIDKDLDNIDDQTDILKYLLYHSLQI